MSRIYFNNQSSSPYKISLEVSINSDNKEYLHNPDTLFMD